MSSEFGRVRGSSAWYQSLKVPSWRKAHGQEDVLRYGEGAWLSRGHEGRKTKCRNAERQKGDYASGCTCHPLR